MFLGAAMLWLAAMLWIASLGNLIVASAIDLMRRMIPNRHPVLMAGGGVGLRLISWTDPLWVSLLIAGITLVTLGYIARHGFIGGGDAKMIAAVTLLVPPAQVMLLLIAIAIAGGLLSCCYLLLRLVLNGKNGATFSVGRDPPRGLRAVLWREGAQIADGGQMPYAFAILGGVAYVALQRAFACWHVMS
jgi:prepilin peptidase CpaA